MTGHAMRLPLGSLNALGLDLIAARESAASAALIPNLVRLCRPLKKLMCDEQPN
jgi:hypothetical protein